MTWANKQTQIQTYTRLPIVFFIKLSVVCDAFLFIFLFVCLCFTSLSVGLLCYEASKIC